MSLLVTFSEIYAKGGAVYVFYGGFKCRVSKGNMIIETMFVYSLVVS